MEIITYPILFIACLVWFFSTWGENRERAKREQAKDDAEEAAYQRESAYFRELHSRADNGDEDAIKLLRWHESFY